MNRFDNAALATVTARSARRAYRDPLYVMRAVGKEPDPWQAKVLQSTSTRILLLCARQVGKSTVTAAAACTTAIAERDSLILLLSPSLRQSGELFRKVMEFYHAIKGAPPLVAESVTKAELENGSRIVSLPEKEGTIRGFSGVKLMVIEEAAWVLSGVYSAVKPMLATSGGKLIALSTPFGKRGWFYKAWLDESGPWERHQVTAYQCPRIPAEFLAQEKREKLPADFAQEYLAEFQEATSSVFRAEDIARAFESPDISPLFGGGPATDDDDDVLDERVRPLWES